jgi:pyruvate dehydrogenase E1 component beta subunit
VVARIQEHAFADLRAGVERVCAMEVPVPWSEPLAAATLPRVESIMAAARRTGA